MAYLKRQIKSVLLFLASEFDTQVNENMKVKQIIDAIVVASDYNEKTGNYFWMES